MTLDELAAGEFTHWLDSPDIALEHIPAFILPSEQASYQRGTPVTVAGAPGVYRIYLQGQFLGLGRWEDGCLRNVVNLC